MNAEQKRLLKELEEWRAKLLSIKQELDKAQWNINCIRKEINEAL